MDTGSLAGEFLCRLSVVTTALFLLVYPQFAIDCHRRSNYRGVGHFGAKFANFVHKAAVVPMQNATRRAQEMHFEYKNITSFRGFAPWPPDQGLRLQTALYRLALAMVLYKLNCSTKIFLKYFLFYITNELWPMSYVYNTVWLVNCNPTLTHSSPWNKLLNCIKEWSVTCTGVPKKGVESSKCLYCVFAKYTLQSLLLCWLNPILYRKTFEIVR